MRPFPNSAGHAQHGKERDQQDLDQIVAGIFGSRIGNALERCQEELHRRPPRISGSRLKNPQFAPLQAPSAQVICDSPAREGATIRTALKDLSGVLVSDFYAAYDVIDCPQQKCLIHFIRDLNDALLARPFDEELRELAQTFSGLVKPMVETVDRRGLKRRYLAKHRDAVERFYEMIS